MTSPDAFSQPPPSVPHSPSSQPASSSRSASRTLTTNSRSPHFALSYSSPSSPVPSRFPSPAPIPSTPALKLNDRDVPSAAPNGKPEFRSPGIYLNGKSPYSNGKVPLSHDVILRADTPGTLPADVYDTTLPWWRAAIRRKLTQSIEWESRVLAKMQVRTYFILHSVSISIVRGRTTPIFRYPIAVPHYFGVQAFFAQLLIFIPFTGTGAYPLARRVLCLHVLPRNTHVLHDRPARPIFLRICRDGPRVSLLTPAAHS